MEKPRFQIKLRWILAAMFWVGVACTAWLVELREVPSLNGIVWWTGLRAVAPCAAAGALFGRPSYGAYIGIIGWGVFLGPSFITLALQPL